MLIVTDIFLLVYNMEIILRQQSNTRIMYTADILYFRYFSLFLLYQFVFYLVLFFSFFFNFSDTVDGQANSSPFSFMNWTKNEVRSIAFFYLYCCTMQHNNSTISCLMSMGEYNIMYFTEKLRSENLQNNFVTIISQRSFIMCLLCRKNVVM